MPYTTSMVTMLEVEPIATDAPTTYFESCWMKPNEAERVFQIINQEFPGVKIVLHEDGRDELNRSGEIGVTFEIPREGVFMPDFFKAFFRALQP